MKRGKRQTDPARPPGKALEQSSQIAEGPEKKRGVFCVQKHDATRLHYDVRLEIAGVLMCFAVPKGPSYDPKVKRLAIETQDRPLTLLDLEARIPEGQYGAGDMLLWDLGTYETVPADRAEAMRAKGHLHVELFGEKLRGGWHFVRPKGPGGSKAEWLMFKAADATADPALDIVALRPESIKSGKSATRGPRRVGASSAGRTASSLVQVVGDVARPTSIGELRIDLDVAAYLYEIKYDGYRLRGVKAGDDVRLFTRGGHDWTARFAPIAAALRGLPAREVVIDGEVCVVDDAGHPSFQALQAWLAGERHPEDPHTALAYVAFDLTWLDGRDLRDAKLEERRELLETLLQGSRAPLSFSRASAPTTMEELTGILATVRSAGLEGLVAKRRGSTYVPGPSGLWRKLKFSQRQDCVIVGWVPMTGSREDLGALILAVFDEGKLRYAGRVGAGVDGPMRARLLAALAPLEVDKAAVSVPRTPGARWVRPVLVCEVEHTERLRDGSLRTPVFVGLREDKAPEECTVDDGEPIAPEPAPAPSTATPAPALPRLSSPSKVLFPRDGITKQDVLAYYVAIAPVLLPHLASRPITLQRWPDGIDDEAWYQHNAPSPLPAFVHFLAVEKRRRVIVDNVETLAWLANLAALTLHAWSSRVTNLEQPDYTILDLDPGEGSWKDVIRVALAIRTITESLSLPTAVKTSGQRGLHIVVPLAPGPTHDEATAFAGRVAEAVAKVLPDVATTERAKERRKGRLYIDYLINGRGKAVVAPYSIRAQDGAPVSTPLAWSEVTEQLDPRSFTIRTVPDRVAKHGDLFAIARTGRGRIR